MKMPKTTLIAAVAAVLALPALAGADKPASKPHKPASHHGPVGNHAPAQPGSKGPKSPSAQCRAERSAMGETNFKNTYGTNRNKSNAFGKCVSRHARDTTAEEQQTRLNAATKCRAEQRADPAAFKANYGTNRNKSNAFGKCVSKAARSGG
jgi:hypothetical protein